ncbi:MAG: UDP-N-acetylglucosamine 1-carboxyvinyltransferase [Lachnospiraceae bacterium]|nr:UDP-N-acetylglucosamine 1-carboxyvinyltransferase [Lachnospiraceae bacterium]
MSYLKIVGKRPLAGEITVQGSKNAALPILAACLIGEGPCVIDNCPRIRDVEDTLFILNRLGVGTKRSKAAVSVDASELRNVSVCGLQAERIRSSVLFSGALLGRMGEAVFPLPGGCAIGSRPIDLHLEVMRALGAHISIEEGIIHANAKTLRGCRIRLRALSVGATENGILAAVCADGETVIENAAREPEVEELCRFLVLRGAKIFRSPDGALHIEGKQPLSPVRFSLQPDRIVAGTYLCAVACCGGRIRICNLPFQEMETPIGILRKMGMDVDQDGSVRAELPLKGIAHLATAPYPGFPTDLQPPLMAALCTADGQSRICETVFDNRLTIARQLRKMGAHIEIRENCAAIDGTACLHGGTVSAPDLRGGAALVCAALGAKGETVLGGYEYIARGYENICRDLKKLGADIHLTEGITDL